MTFQWSRKKFSLKELIAQWKDKLPVIINVAEGYTGLDGDDTYDIATGSVFFVFSVDVQSRIVALTEDERYLSMARSCPVYFNVIRNDRSLSEPYRLNDIVSREHNNLGDLRIQMAAPEFGGLGPMDAGSSDIQGTLRVLDLYDERYLLCHSFLEGAFCVTGVVSVPSYLPLTVILATGIKHGSRTDFKAFLHQVNTSAIKFQQEYKRQPRNAEEIVVFSDPPQGDYEYIETSTQMSRIPSFKIVDTTRNPETEVVQSKDPTAEPTETRQGEYPTVPRLPPRNPPRITPPVEEKLLESRATWTTSNRRPLPPVPDQTGRGSSVTEEYRVDGRKSEAVKSSGLSKAFPLVKESLVLKVDSQKSPSQSPKFSLKFRKILSELEDVLSDSETPQRGRSTGNALNTKAPRGGSATSAQKPEGQKNNSPVSWSSWPFTSPRSTSEKSTATLQKPRPPVPKKPSMQSIVTKKPTLISQISTGMFRELNDSFLELPKSCLQRPAALTLGQLEGDFDSYYDEIKSPLTGNRLSQVDDQSSGTGEDAPQREFDSGFTQPKYPVSDDSSEILSLRSTDAVSQSEGKSDSESGALDSSYEEISLPSSRKTSGTASDSGLSTAPINASTPKLLHSGVHNFINAKHSTQWPRQGRSDDSWKVFNQSLDGQVRAPPIHAVKQSWRSADDVPTDIASLSVEQVSACLKVLNLGQYVRTFREQQIDGALLSCLDTDVLFSDFGFRKFDAIKLAKFARDGWRPKIDQEDTSC